MPDETTTADRLDELAGPLEEACSGVRQRVREMMCPCLAGKDCLWRLGMCCRRVPAKRMA